MTTKLAIIAALGLLIGALLGGIGGAWMAADWMGNGQRWMFQQRSLYDFADKTVQLRLLETGKLDALQRMLLGSYYAETIGLAAGTIEGSDKDLLKKQIGLASQIKAVKDDKSEIGQMAAEARKRIMESN